MQHDEQTKEFALMARTALLCGIIDHHELIAIADIQISMEENPDQLLIDLSHASPDNFGATLNILSAYLADDKTKPDSKPFIAYLGQKYFAWEMPLKKTVRSLYRVIFETTISEETEKRIRQIELNFESFSPMTDAEAQRELEKFLSEYIQYPIPEFLE